MRVAGSRNAWSKSITLSHTGVLRSQVLTCSRIFSPMSPSLPLGVMVPQWKRGPAAWARAARAEIPAVRCATVNCSPGWGT
ncbi:hypothetical protein Strvi_1879 [Streptomyces violaceusniger Tu 4113]|uniref:Uncharacterized protein n=1 Tax=Streptomyces violaceusniger (strain Tu 4113) TaxID=653045 RepID=G2P272_STRV4|nr:hypothetical protein Strvi_1879 [Streptomyces violaceusniger Tu 4113]